MCECHCDEFDVARIGEEVEDFAASAFAEGKIKDEIKLSDYKGKWVVLFFYPADFTFVCPTELTGVAKVYDQIREMGGEVLAISTDSHFVHMMWNEYELSKMVDGGLPYPMLYDADGRIGRYYQVYNEQSGMDIRGTFIIDPDGVLQAQEVFATNVGRSAKELLRQLSAFKFSRENGGVIPCDWQPGDEVMNPGDDLVGHVHDKFSSK